MVIFRSYVSVVVTEKCRGQTVALDARRGATAQRNVPGVHGKSYWIWRKLVQSWSILYILVLLHGKIDKSFGYDG